MSSSDVVLDYQTGTYRVYRRSSSDVVQGRPVVPVDLDADVVAVDPATGRLTVPGHGMSTGMGPVWATTTDVLPQGLDADTPLWPIVVDADTIELAASRDDAKAGVAVALADAGVGALHLATFFWLGASIQELDGRELKDLPEGQRGEDVRDLFSVSELKNQGGGWEADVFEGVEIAGDRWRVERARRYSIVSDHWRARLVRVTTP